jgi:hypothetical protein
MATATTSAPAIREFSTTDVVRVSIRHLENDEKFFQDFASFMVRSGIRAMISISDRNQVYYFFTEEDAEMVYHWLSAQENMAQVSV